jgi:hypothetical protein
LSRGKKSEPLRREGCLFKAQPFSGLKISFQDVQAIAIQGCGRTARFNNSTTATTPIFHGNSRTPMLVLLPGRFAF